MSQNFPGGTDKNDVKFKSGYLIARSRFERGISQVKSRRWTLFFLGGLRKIGWLGLGLRSTGSGN